MIPSDIVTDRKTNKEYVVISVDRNIATVVDVDNMPSDPERLSSKGRVLMASECEQQKINRHRLTRV